MHIQSAVATLVASVTATTGGVVVVVVVVVVVGGGGGGGGGAVVVGATTGMVTGRANPVNELLVSLVTTGASWCVAP
jgi:hypothetical protein